MNGTTSIPPYQDHVGLWADELQAWMPDSIFDAHVHLSPPHVVGEISHQRRKQPLAAFASFTWEQAVSWYGNLYRGKTVAGMIAFPLPLREVRLEAANEYIAELTRRNPTVKGFLLCDPQGVKSTIAQFEAGLRSGVRFCGVKPYYDLLGKSNYDTRMAELIPRELLEFMGHERLMMMLHTTGIGMGDPENREFVKMISDDYPGIRVILAHMGRYLDPAQCLDFLESDALDSPALVVEMSSASSVEVYRRLLARRELWGRLLFGSDLPFGLITGVEEWSQETGPVFVTRDRYAWSDRRMNAKFSRPPSSLSYNTYHVIKALKDAIDGLHLAGQECERLKEAIFRANAERLFARGSD